MFLLILTVLNRDYSPPIIIPMKGGTSQPILYKHLSSCAKLLPPTLSRSSGLGFREFRVLGCSVLGRLRLAVEGPSLMVLEPKAAYAREKNTN